MTASSPYGASAASLPKSMVRLRRSGSGNPSLVWTGINGVRLLSETEDQEARAASLLKFIRSHDGEIDWSQFDPGSILYHAADGDNAQGINAVLENYAQRSESVIFIWRGLVAPSVQVDKDHVATHLPGIVEAFPDFRIICADDQVLVDVSFSGELTVARMPS